MLKNQPSLVCCKKHPRKMTPKVVAAILAIVTLIVSTESAKIKSFEIITMIQNRFAETTISSEVMNNNSIGDEEVGFHVMLPKEAFITYFAMTINGTVYEGEIEEKEKAEKKFQEAKKQHKTAAIVKTIKQADKVFKTSVNVAAGVSVNFTLIYQQLLRKLNGKLKNTIILLGNTLGPSVIPKVEVFICESRAIRDVSAESTYKYDATITTIGSSSHVEFLNIEIPQERRDVEYHGTFNLNDTQSGSFIVEYELEENDVSGDIIVNNGFLVHFFAPKIESSQRRTVFVLDVSGSMLYLKLEQLTQAMLKILDKFNENDRIGLIKFTHEKFLWKNGTMQTGSPENIESAKEFIKFSHPAGGTEIWQALKTALEMLYEDTETEEVVPENNFIVLLTDGLGTLSKEEMIRQVEQVNDKTFAINTIGFGDGVDANMLKAVAANNHGSWKQIMESFDAQLQIENYVDELGMTLVSGFKIEFSDIVEEKVQSSNRYSAGKEIISIAKLKEDVDFSDTKSHTAVIKGEGPSGKDVVFHARFSLNQKQVQCKTFDRGEIIDFAKKAFGMVMLDKVLRAHDGELDSTVKAELKEKAINVSLEYSLVSSVTSMLVIKPEDRMSIEKAIEMNDEVLPAKTSIYGTGGGWHRQASGWSGYGDPHFVVRVTDDINVCFNWRFKGDKVMNLVNDVENSLVINALLMPGRNQKDEDAIDKHGLYIRVATIILQRDQLEIIVDEEKALVFDLGHTKEDGGIHLPLDKGISYNYTYKNVYFEVLGTPNTYKSLLNLTINGNIIIVIDTHRHNPKVEHSRAHVDVSLTDTKGLSDSMGGFFGSFHIPKEMQKMMVRIEENKNKRKEEYPHLLVFKKKKMMVQRKEKKLPHTNGTFDCWWVGQVDKLIGHPLEDFEEESMFSVPK